MREAESKRNRETTMWSTTPFPFYTRTSKHYVRLFILILFGNDDSTLNECDSTCNFFLLLYRSSFVPCAFLCSIKFICSEANEPTMNARIRAQEKQLHATTMRKMRRAHHEIHKFFEVILLLL